MIIWLHSSKVVGFISQSYEAKWIVCVRENKQSVYFITKEKEKLLLKFINKHNKTKTINKYQTMRQTVTVYSTSNLNLNLIVVA